MQLIYNTTVVRPIASSLKQQWKNDMIWDLTLNFTVFYNLHNPQVEGPVLSQASSERQGTLIS